MLVTTIMEDPLYLNQTVHRKFPVQKGGRRLKMRSHAMHCPLRMFVLPLRAFSYSQSQLSMVKRQRQGWPAFYLVQGPWPLSWAAACL